MAFSKGNRAKYLLYRLKTKLRAQGIAPQIGVILDVAAQPVIGPACPVHRVPSGVGE